MAAATLSVQIEDAYPLYLFLVLFQPLFVSADRNYGQDADLVSELTLCRRGKVTSWYVHNL